MSIYTPYRPYLIDYRTPILTILRSTGEPMTSYQLHMALKRPPYGLVATTDTIRYHCRELVKSGLVSADASNPKAVRYAAVREEVQA